MGIEMFNIVVLGDSFPVGSLKLEDFEFRHRRLREVVRLPMALQAQGEGVTLLAIPQRFDVTINAPDRIPVQVEGLVEMASGFFDYVGRRTVTAVGHNIVWRLDGTADTKAAILDGILKTERVNAYLGSREPVSSDIGLFFKRGTESQGQLTIGTHAPGDITLNINFHFDAADSSPKDAVTQLAASVDTATQLAEGFVDAFTNAEVHL